MNREISFEIQSVDPVRPAVSMALAIFVLLFMPSVAKAASLEEMQRQLDLLKAQVATLEAQIEEEQKARDKADSADAKVTWNGGPAFSSADGRNTFKLKGRVVADAALIGEDKAVTGQGPVNAAELRAVRLGASGRIDGDFDYGFEVDIVDGARLTDAHVTYLGLPVEISVGHLKAGTTLEKDTSDLYITFMERSSLFEAFSLTRQVGLQLDYEGKSGTLMAGIYRGGTDWHEGLTLAGRATLVEEMGETLLHMGLNARYRERRSDEALFHYSVRPRLHLADELIDTGQIGRSDLLLGGELALERGPLSLQGEYMRLAVATPLAGDREPTFSGYYISGSWFLTGERRPYGGGRFGRVPVAHPITKGGAGAWEVALRYDAIDLSDGPYRGGRQNTWLAGLTWYLNDYFRLMANYNRSGISDGLYDGAGIDGFGLRSQLEW